MVHSQTDRNWYVSELIDVQQDADEAWAELAGVQQDLDSARHYISMLSDRWAADSNTLNDTRLRNNMLALKCVVYTDLIDELTNLLLDKRVCQHNIDWAKINQLREEGGLKEL